MGSPSKEDLEQAHREGQQFGRDDKSAGLADDLMGRSLMAHPTNADPFLCEGDGSRNEALQEAFDKGRENGRRS